MERKFDLGDGRILVHQTDADCIYAYKCPYEHNNYIERCIPSFMYQTHYAFHHFIGFCYFYLEGKDDKYDNIRIYINDIIGKLYSIDRSTDQYVTMKYFFNHIFDITNPKYANHPMHKIMHMPDNGYPICNVVTICCTDGIATGNPFDGNGDIIKYITKSLDTTRDIAKDIVKYILGYVYNHAYVFQNESGKHDVIHDLKSNPTEYGIAGFHEDPCLNSYASMRILESYGTIIGLTTTDKSLHQFINDFTEVINNRGKLSSKPADTDPIVEILNDKKIDAKVNTAIKTRYTIEMQYEDFAKLCGCTGYSLTNISTIKYLNDLELIPICIGGRQVFIEAKLLMRNICIKTFGYTVDDVSFTVDNKNRKITIMMIVNPLSVL